MWKLALGMAGILAVVIGAVFFAGQFFFQQELTALPEKDEPASVVASNQEKPSKIENSEPVKEGNIILADAKEPGLPVTPDNMEKSKEPGPRDDFKPVIIPQTQDPVKQALAKQLELAQVPVTNDPAPIAPPLPALPTPNAGLPTSPPPLAPDVGPPPLAAPPAALVDPPQKAVNCPWSLQLEVVKGRTIVTAKAGKDASFRIECDQVDLQSPRGCLKATGKVKITGPGLDGASNALTLNLQEDRLVLEGDVKVKSRRDNQDLELTGDRLNLRLINIPIKVGKVLSGIDF